MREVKLGLMSAHDRMDVLESINQDSSLMGTCFSIVSFNRHIVLEICYLHFPFSPLLYFVHFIFFVVLGVDSGSPTLCIGQVLCC